MPEGGLIAQAEDVADHVLRRSKHLMPHVARFFLVSTFIEDGVRMWYQWGEQRDYIDSSWGCGSLLGTRAIIHQPYHRSVINQKTHWLINSSKN